MHKESALLRPERIRALSLPMWVGLLPARLECVPLVGSLCPRADRELAKLEPCGRTERLASTGISRSRTSFGIARSGNHPSRFFTPWSGKTVLQSEEIC